MNKTKGQTTDEKDLISRLKRKNIIAQISYWEPFSYWLLFQKELIENYMTEPEIVKMVQEKIKIHNLFFKEEDVPLKVSRAIDTLYDLTMLDEKWVERGSYTTKGYRNIA